MVAKKGEVKNFDLGVVSAIVLKRSILRANKERVNMGDVAEVNEHLFPFSGRCMGLLVAAIAVSKSRPEILRQYPVLEEIDLTNASPNELCEVLGLSIRLVSTGE